MSYKNQQRGKMEEEVYRCTSSDSSLKNCIDDCRKCEFHKKVKINKID